MLRILLSAAALAMSATASLAQTIPPPSIDESAAPRTAEECRGMGDEAERTRCLNSLQPNAAPTPLRPRPGVSQVPPRLPREPNGGGSTGPTNPSSPPPPPAPR